MAIPHTVPAALGAVAFLPTTAMLGIHIILARSPADHAPSVQISGAFAALFEAAVFVTIVSFTLSHIVPWAPSGESRLLRRLWFGAGLPLCTIAWAVSVSNFVCFGRVADDPYSTILGWEANDFMVGSSVTLGLTFATQLVFFVFHFLSGRTPDPYPKTLVTEQGKGSRLRWRLKTVPYHETAPNSAKESGSNVSFGIPTPPGSSGGRSRADTFSSIRSSFSHAVLPITSKTRLLSLGRRFSRKSSSLDLTSQQGPRPRSAGMGFEYWDTSAVNPENRQTVLDSSSPPPSRCLATIPASPSNSRSPSPGRSLDMLEPPRPTRRSRSYSSVSSRVIQAQRVAFTQQTSHSEAHIHPLFRSDSPAPPMATLGTVVVAAPNAGRVISDKQSIRSIQSLRRLRSESLPPTAPSPLSRAASCESFMHCRENSKSLSLREVAAAAVKPATIPGHGAGASGASGAGGAVAELKIEPPIPEYVLNAGSRSSLVLYHSRSKIEEGGQSPTATV